MRNVADTSRRKRRAEGAIEVRTDELDVAGGFDCIALGYTVGTAASLLSIEIYGLVPRFAEVPTTAWDEVVD